MFMFINVVQSVMLSCMVVLYRPLVSGTSMEILLDPGEVQHWVIFQSWPYRGLVWSFSSSASVTCHQATCLLRNKAFSWDSEFSIVAFFCPIHFGFHERAGGLFSGYTSLGLNGVLYGLSHHHQRASPVTKPPVCFEIKPSHGTQSSR